MISAAVQAPGDVLGAASLLLAILAVLYSLWYTDINAALKVAVPKHLEDADEQRRQVSEAVKTRAAPLAVAAVVLAIIFLPEALRLTIHWVRQIQREGLWDAVTSYDPVALSIVAVVFFLLALTGYTVWLAIELVRLQQKLSLSVTTR